MIEQKFAANQANTTVRAPSLEPRLRLNPGTGVFLGPISRFWIVNLQIILRIQRVLSCIWREIGDSRVFTVIRDRAEQDLRRLHDVLGQLRSALGWLESAELGVPYELAAGTVRALKRLRGQARIGVRRVGCGRGSVGSLRACIVSNTC